MKQEQWTAVDHYITELLVPADAVLEAGWPDVPPAQPHAEPAIGSN